MPRVERSFLIGSLFGPLIVLAIVGIDVFIPAMLSLGLASADPEIFSFCESFDLTFELLISGVPGVAAVGLLTWFIVNQMNGSREADARLSPRAAVSGALISAVLVLTLLVSGATTFECVAFE
ncbi:MAG: hypothetical protein ACPHCI_06880 [Solirubrobacterales bacterium]